MQRETDNDKQVLEAVIGDHSRQRAHEVIARLPDCAFNRGEMMKCKMTIAAMKLYETIRMTSPEGYE
jgi:hypothetical protein